MSGMSPGMSDMSSLMKCLAMRGAMNAPKAYAKCRTCMQGPELSFHSLMSKACVATETTKNKQMVVAYSRNT